MKSAIFKIVSRVEKQTERTKRRKTMVNDDNDNDIYLIAHDDKRREKIM